MNTSTYQITREKHLDHLVRVVPIIVLAYAVHSYILLQMEGPLGPDMLMIMGGLLVMMISAFVAYDVHHEVTLYEDRLEIKFLGLKQIIPFDDILTVHAYRPEDSFGTIFIQGKRQHARLYFVDDADKIKKWIEQRKTSLPLAA